MSNKTNGLTSTEKSVRCHIVRLLNYLIKADKYGSKMHDNQINSSQVVFTILKTIYYIFLFIITCRWSNHRGFFNVFWTFLQGENGRKVVQWWKSEQTIIIPKNIYNKTDNLTCPLLFRYIGVLMYWSDLGFFGHSFWYNNDDRCPNYDIQWHNKLLPINMWIYLPLVDRNYLWSCCPGSRCDRPH